MQTVLQILFITWSRWKEVYAFFETWKREKNWHSNKKYETKQIVYPSLIEDN